MALQAIFGIAALVAVSSAAALPVIQLAEVPTPNTFPEVVGPIPAFEVTEFKAQALVLSDRNYINFYVTPYRGAEPAHCFSLGTTLSHSLNSVPQTWCSHAANDSSDTSDRVWFSWTMGDDVDPTAAGAGGTTGTDPVDSVNETTGAYLKIVRQGGGQTRDEAIHHFDARYLVYEGEGDMVHQVFTGPQNFTMRALRVDARGES
ncbi:uncharacterized protein THITE_2128280 [Thermothielavioides terrestris NRRL 8126]|uniref:Ubiquitin 3 binding protein But2 C-terminal domain-containing protein n=1 Tax=Thermothielavioides terrestris (strain ATCC 38088 / NRRL 8126) TaxID=578455 RepID=G2QY81_THETT|nr:uncharacterized protein THITE_2128280 [Thermothielavioides terrestris NRRL 8126]AEO66179.1 hypothetical protein THITE_2128280 [Thermothielavioides terrestris NRRL 8126]